ncbi:branched-chain amino acid ABC transporter [Mycetocola tolaasinivorans]|uniref:Branched-chain amino acid ABC transporter n=1 Tax=Mycetocola tolaasinivorans TaxID=76635 RepID=A0A3L7ABR1_9MICO|nr:AzlD domain-containing protein [Mycetocola tolaasinivorans]RLP76822.1 branched-chain amino acid ABC transporter [Mycetocola tolaasinivorans]
MIDPGYLAATVLVAGGITFALRAVPLLAVVPLRRSAAVRFLADELPAGIMIVLVLYCLRDLSLTELSPTLPTLIALNVTIALQVWKRNALLSIFAGTAVNVTLLSTAFPV